MPAFATARVELDEPYDFLISSISAPSNWQSELEAFVVRRSHRTRIRSPIQIILYDRIDVPVELRIILHALRVCGVGEVCRDPLDSRLQERADFADEQTDRPIEP